MDPKTPSNLDPKLKEVYDRVMGTSTSPATPPLAGNTPPVPTQAPPTPIQNTSPAPQPAMTSPSLPPLPSHEATPPQSMGTLSNSQVPPPISSSEANKATVDYAALAAKYATPTPTIPPESPNQRPTTPTSFNFGVTNTDKKEKGKDKEKDATSTEPKKSGGKRKILLIVGAPLLILVYTIIWIVIFKVDVTTLLPLPQ
ncbi:MAG: hypothetical protein HZC02_04905 [Candidatus Levybacteria bacterium]|nr:hypothetical protein [Candidatus Levybacteria bacterium]